ncbi:MAG: hypothetical protein CLLPBCKN_005173 [Chroococcidiopsis cubana SAG 39.79]|jgi:hypothetical protein|uniref:DUF2993 domain-containing protein n=1 Tax=Chroococcidiopsis cubana SAG 39.79 TaxID=388085 RepID=A0AB37UBX2_9CYAN|nr:hypothetical protein [Chroococcidiopsis cubana]MDZ4875753.1 hypothetical protein [Chroococcidiopsis cubana SAG 39.79]PSB62586.1 hypothetical protein C7B79_17445 [Chroococcidiopsis cubana CCALA 043]RUT04940.1 hypothetical protein DSM107010_56260 [Chroococcidiopsis cubana SAG 39.79]
MFHWLLKLPSFRLGFLLPLPLLLMAFGLFGEQLTNNVLSLSFVGLDKLQAENSHLQVQLPIKATVIKAEIEKELELTEVEIETTKSPLKKLIFAFPTVDSNALQTILARELGFSSQAGLQSGTQIQGQLKFSVQGILAQIDKKQGATKIEIKTIDAALKQLELEFPTTDIERLKATLAQELKLSRQEIRMLVSYRIVE